MDETSSPRGADEAVGVWLSCCGRFMLKLPWRKGRIRRDTRRQGNLCWNLGASFRAKDPKPAGGFKYDPLSYAQNFDEGSWDKGMQVLCLGASLQDMLLRRNQDCWGVES